LIVQWVTICSSRWRQVNLSYLCALAEFERNLIRERTQAGLIAARARGRKGGRPKALTGKQLGIARDLYDKRHPIAEICQTLKVSKPTLYRYIKAGERHGLSSLRNRIDLI
jgi:DNA invertase Pin-like site-specific DNA recombinase